MLTNGKATWTTQSLTLGSHSITAHYWGDANFTGSTSNPPLSITVAAAVLDVTNMAPLTIDPQQILGQIQLEAGSDAGGETLSIDTGTARGGTISGDANGGYTYAPNDTSNVDAPWDPANPDGGGPGDGAAGSAPSTRPSPTRTAW